MTDRFGVPILDGPLGPLPDGATVLLRADPAVEALPFLLQSANERLRHKAPVVILTAHRPPSRVRALLDELDPEPSRENLHFIDAFSALLGSREDVDFPVAMPSDLHAVTGAIEAAAHAHRGAVLYVDSLSGLMDHANLPAFLDVRPRLMSALKKFRWSVSLVTDWPYGDDVERALGAFEAVVELHATEERVVVHQMLSVKRSPWSKSGARGVRYKVQRPGGVVAHIPKVLLVGPTMAGKTTLLRALGADVKGGRTAADPEHATVMDQGIQVELLALPGAERFDALLAVNAVQAAALVLLVDAADPARFSRAKEMLAKTKAANIPLVILLNKQDLEGAVEADAFAQATGLPRTAVVLCTALDPKAARQALRETIERVLPGAHA